MGTVASSSFSSKMSQDVKIDLDHSWRPEQLPATSLIGPEKTKNQAQTAGTLHAWSMPAWLAQKPMLAWAVPYTGRQVMIGYMLMALARRQNCERVCHCSLLHIAASPSTASVCGRALGGQSQFAELQCLARLM